MEQNINENNEVTEEINPPDPDPEENSGGENTEKKDKHRCKDPKPETLAVTVTLDIISVVLASFFVAVGYYFFINANNFAPGGLGGVASIIGYLTKLNSAYFIMALNLPIFVLVFFLVHKKTAIYLSIYVVLQSLFMLLFEKVGWFDKVVLSFIQKDMNSELIIPSLAGGLITGIGYALMFKRFGASGGTYAIATLIKKKKPDANVAWLSCAMDACVVFIAIFVYKNFTAAICTLVNLVLANEVVDIILKGLKNGYKFEIITDKPKEIAQELIERLGRSVTQIHAIGMYSHEEKELLICLVRKRELGEFYRILRRYPGTFAYITQVNEVMGKFKH